MSEIPIYLKTTPNIRRPADPEYYLLTQDGLFFCRNYTFFESDVKARRPPSTLAQHEPCCRIRYPKLSAAALEYAIGFFDRVFALHGSEAVILLLWDRQRARYKLWVPEQEPTVWHSSNGIRSPMDVTYKAPLSLPRQYLQVGDIHSHADLGAYASYTDKQDEVHRDGIHIVVGHIDEEPPEFHLEIAVDGHRFPLQFDQILAGYRQRRQIVPTAWMERVRVIVKRPIWPSWSTSYDTCGSHRLNASGSYQPQNSDPEGRQEG